jgi:hypothetical protein
MDSPKEGARRDVFIWKVLDQLEGISRWIGEPFRAHAWDDGGEAVLAVWQQGEEDEVLRVTARFDDAGAERAGWDEKLSLAMEWRGEAAELLALGWSGSRPDIERGLDSHADHAEGEYAIGKVTDALRTDIGAALASLAAPASRALARSRPRSPNSIVDASFEIVEPVVLAQRLPETQKANGPAPNLAQEPDLGLLRHALDALPEMEGVEAQRIFGAFIKAAGSRSALRQGDIAAFVQGGLAELHAFQEAYLEGRSGFTQAGVGLKGAALIGAFIVAMGAETISGVFGLGPIIGRNIEALPLAGVGSFLIGGGLLPIAKTDRERRRITAVAVVWAMSLSVLSAKNPELAEPAQSFFTPGETAVKAQADAEAARLKLDAVKARARAGREDKAKTQDTYLSAKKNRLAILDKAASEVKALERDEEAASAAWVSAESAKKQAMKADPSRNYAEGVVFMICSLLNAMGPVFIGNYLSRVEGDHQSALGRARRRRQITRQARMLRESPSAQKQKARVMLTAMRSYYADVLLKSGRFTEAEAEKMVNSAFGNAGAIVKEAVGGFRAAMRPKRTWIASVVSRGNSFE